MSTLLQDVRYGLRTLRKSPGFTLVAVLTLALGIGANTAIFSIVENVLLRPLPYPEPERLVDISNSYLPAVPYIGLSPGDYADWRREAASVSAMGAYVSIAQGFNLTGDAQPQRIQASYASASLFPMLGIRPVLGHSFTPDEDRAGVAPAVMLSHHLWEARFGSDRLAVGRSIVLDGQRYEVIGVLPAGFDLLRWADVWMPIGQFADDLTSHIHHDFNVIGRLRPGVSLAQAQAEFTALNHQEEVAFPETHRHWNVVLSPLERPEAARLRTTLLLLFGAVGLVLLIACVNITNLLLVRNAGREREIAIRAALGAGIVSLTRQLLVESLLLSFAAGLFGLLAALAGSKALLSLVPASLGTLGQARLNGAVLAFAFAVCLVTGIVCGVLPALRALKPNLNDVLSTGSKGAASVGSHRVHNALISAEIAMALVPLIGAGLLLRSFQHLVEVDPGFQPDHVLTMNVPQAALTLAQVTKMNQAQVLAFTQKQSQDFELLCQRIRALPGVKAAGGIDLLPPGTPELRQASRFVIEGRPVPNSELRPILQFRTVSPDYFSAMGIPLIKGRLFIPEDWRQQNVVVIDRTMERRFWPAGNALGSRINLCSLAPQPCWSTIIGVVGDARQFGLDTAPTFDAYFSGGWTPYLVIRAASDPAGLPAAVVAVIHKSDPNLPITEIRTMDDVLSDSMSSRRFSLLLVGIFAGVALLLAAVGIYGVTTYVVECRIREIGIRMALGAQPADVRRLVIRRGAKVTLTGVVIGLAAALGLGRLLSSLLFELKPGDPLTFAGVALLLTTVALVSCYLPARRAMRVDPIVALRYE